MQKHEVNFVCCRNVFTDEEFTFFGNDALQNFILFLYTQNHGKNICIAHNASGYDTRLLFSKFAELDQDDEIEINPIMRGGKFMQLKVNKHLIFRDSLLHVKGSLKSLAKDFCDGLLDDIKPAQPAQIGNDRNPITGVPFVVVECQHGAENGRDHAETDRRPYRTSRVRPVHRVAPATFPPNCWLDVTV